MGGLNSQDPASDELRDFEAMVQTFTEANFNDVGKQNIGYMAKDEKRWSTMVHTLCQGNKCWLVTFPITLSTDLPLAALARLHTQQTLLLLLILFKLVTMSRGSRAALPWVTLVALVAIKTKYHRQVLASHIQDKHIEHQNNWAT